MYVQCIQDRVDDGKLTVTGSQLVQLYQNSRTQLQDGEKRANITEQTEVAPCMFQNATISW